MKSTNRYDFLLSSKRCSTCEDMRQLRARTEAAFLNVRDLYSAAPSPALQNLEEELKPTSGARKLIHHAIQAHLTSQQSQTTGVRFAA